MSDPMVAELAAIRGQITTLEKRRVTHRKLSVTSADAGTATFTATLPDGQALTGLTAPAQFLPEAGQTVTVRLEGATPIYDPAGLAIDAVGDREVSSISADFISAGLLTGEIALANRITTALEGARVEFNPLGFQKFLADGTITISLTGDENLLTGTFMTATTGRRVEIGASGNVGRVSMIAADGTTGLLESYTEGGTESIRMVMPITGAWEAWNGIQFQSNNRGYITAGTLDITVADTSTFALSVASDDGAAGVQPTRSNRLTVSNDTIRMFVGAVASEGSVDVVRHGVADARNRSPRVQLRCEGGTQAMNLKAVIESDGTGLRLEVTNTADAYGEIRASAFTVSSDEAGKTEIADWAGDAEALLDVFRPRIYRRLLDGGAPGPLEVGFVAQEMPADVLTPDGLAVNPYSLQTVTLAAVKRAKARLSAQETRIKTLEDDVAAIKLRLPA